MRDERSYKKPVSHEEAIAELKRNSGSLFDPQVVQVFLYVLNDIKLSKLSLEAPSIKNIASFS
jgi:HD-GYP domain-containing protein (c-di-GMP phosphodiesterase class II)